eukprot:CAMPEP_0169109170 /NCGR_PEP_ID=MMETSP1015-20121227/25822_1 /TAXON_ID=342587 /ORGANISM="Karlodinium micrum, Strain CCMP2283" /LENGTH=163 /DNA_ID=CAMNT_0009170849 /DNA_START=63 /DNA_END=554 /DNA_ORIENTATION=+
MSAEEVEGNDDQDIFYVAEEMLSTLKKRLADKDASFTKEDIDKLTQPDDLADDAMMVPVDMRGVGEEFDDVEAMVEKLGAKAAFEAFLKAREYFEANKDGESEEDRPKPMTAKEWKDVLQDDDMDLLMEGEEEELDLLEGEEEEPDGSEEDEGEPEAKKAKTD